VEGCASTFMAGAKCNGEVIKRDNWWVNGIYRNLIGEPEVLFESTKRLEVVKDAVEYRYEGPECVPRNFPETISKKFLKTARVKSVVTTSSGKSEELSLGVSLAKIVNLDAKANVVLNETGSGEREDTVAEELTVTVAICTKMTRRVTINQTSLKMRQQVGSTLVIKYLCSGNLLQFITECPAEWITSSGVGYWDRLETVIPSILRRCVRCTTD